MDGQQRNRLSRTLTYLLRHKAADHGLEVDDAGWALLSAVLALPVVAKRNGKDFPAPSTGDIRQVVAECKKKRFELKEEEKSIYIRATQGHSQGVIDSSTALTPLTSATLFPACIHCTKSKFLESIKAHGLNRMARQHIHMASREMGDGELVSGGRSDSDTFIHIDLAQALADGILFFYSSNGVILTEGINGTLPPKYFSSILVREKKKKNNNHHHNNNSDRKQQRNNAQIQPQKFDLLAVLDFEATCLDKQRIANPEIIEFPVVFVDLHTGKRLSNSENGVFHRYVKPKARLSAFCTELTGISQQTVDGAEDFSTVFKAFLQHYDMVTSAVTDEKKQGGQQRVKNNKRKTCVFLTCGDWDLKRMLPTQCESLNMAVPRMFHRWINVKKAFKQQYHRNGRGMADMLKSLRLPLVGRHHSGIDDVGNIVSIAQQLLRGGYVFDITSQL